MKLVGEYLKLNLLVTMPVIAEGGGGVVWPAACLQVSVEAQVLGVTLAGPPEVVRGTLADAAHVRTVIRTLLSVLDVALKKRGKTY